MGMLFRKCVESRSTSWYGRFAGPSAMEIQSAGQSRRTERLIIPHWRSLQPPSYHCKNFRIDDIPCSGHQCIKPPNMRVALCVPTRFQISKTPPCISRSGSVSFYMPKSIIHTYNLKDPAQAKDDRQYWRERSAEERVSAVEVLRRQFGKFPSGKGYDGSQRLRRVLRVVQ